MNLQAHKLSLIETLLGVNDAKLLSRVEAILKTETREKEIVPMTMEEYNWMIDESLEDYRAGRFITSDELEEEMKGW